MENQSPRMMPHEADLEYSDWAGQLAKANNFPYVEERISK